MPLLPLVVSVCVLVATLPSTVERRQHRSRDDCGVPPNQPVLREVVQIVRRYPLACFVPAVFLGIVIQLAHLLHVDRLGVGAIVFVTGMFAFTLYLAYIEEVAAEAERGVDRIGVRHALALMRRALPLLLAISIATGITLVSITAGVVLALVGLFLLTRWSLAVPIISRNRTGAMAALRESGQLVHGAFWSVATTAALAIVVEQTATSVLPLYIDPSAGEAPWVAWLVGAAVTSLVMPFAGLTVSIAYNRRAEGNRPRLL
jgi:hypothetical protein